MAQGRSNPRSGKGVDGLYMRAVEGKHKTEQSAGASGGSTSFACVVRVCGVLHCNDILAVVQFNCTPFRRSSLRVGSFGLWSLWTFGSIDLFFFVLFGLFGRFRLWCLIVGLCFCFGSSARLSLFFWILSRVSKQSLCPLLLPR